MRRRTRRASGSLQGKRRTPYRQETGVGTRAENPEMANPRGARRRRAWRHLVSTAALPIVGLGVNRISMEHRNLLSRERRYPRLVLQEYRATIINISPRPSQRT